MEKVTKEMLIGELISKYPFAAEQLIGQGIHCFGCCGAAFESIEQGLLAHGKTDKEIEQIICGINSSISKSKKTAKAEKN